MPRPAEIELPRLRQGLYRFFAVALLPPTQTHLDQLAQAAGLLEDLGVDTLAFAEPWLGMRRALARSSDLDTLAGQYVQLFESGTDDGLCPPVESFYVSSARHGGTATVTANLEADFNKLGLAVAGASELGADHISPQLELMAMLCAQEATASERGDLEGVSTWGHEQLEFSDNHLSRWIPRFQTRVRKFAPEGFYRSTVAAVDAFIDHDRELLHLLDRRKRTGQRP